MLDKRITFLRGDLTQDEVAKGLAISRARYSHYETGRSEPDSETIQRMAQYFNVSCDYLLGVIDTPRPLISDKPAQDCNTMITKIPLIGTICAGVTILSKENIDGYLEVPDYIHGDYVLQVKGDSMIGVGILDGDLAICQETTVPQSGQIIVALRDEGAISEASLRFYMNGNGHPYLRAANPAYTNIDYEDGYRTAGTMVALVRKEAPGYHIYKNYISIPGYDEWTEVFELAASTGIKPQRMKSFIEMIKEMGKG